MYGCVIGPLASSPTKECAANLLTLASAASELYRLDMADERKYSGANHTGPAHSSPYPTSRLGQSISLVDVAQAIEFAGASVTSHASARLQVILEQMRGLQAEAAQILQKTKEDLDLHRAECRFNRITGRVYHLYRRRDESLYFSMLSPDDHAGSPPHDYVASYRLEPDQSWTLAEDTARVDQARLELERAFSRHLLR